MNILKTIIVNLIVIAYVSAQDLCPPALLNTLFYDEKVELDWVQMSSYGDVLFDECFAVCSTATENFEIVNVDSCGACSGGWFRYSDGTVADCGTGMFPCDDGGDDDNSAYAGYSGTDSTTEMYAPVDSRLIFGPIDLSNYTAAYIEFIEAYTYPEDANDSNMVEVSIDGGETWEVAYVSDPGYVGNDFWFNTLDISMVAGNEVWVAFRYYDSVGYGEGWFVDDIRVWGGDTGDGDICGTFQNYNVYMDGSLIGTTEMEAYTAEGLENGVEYCFEIKTVYEEGESEASHEACATPMGPFQVEPLSLNFPELEDGEYQEMTFDLINFDTVDYDFNIFSTQVEDLTTVGQDLLADDFNSGGFMNLADAAGAFDAVWAVNDSAGASSTYLVYPTPADGGTFAFVNDDAIGDGSLATNAWLVSNEITLSGTESVFLMADIFYPQPDGPCHYQGLYSDEFHVLFSVDNGTNWEVVDTTMSTGWNDWSSYLYNLTPLLNGATSLTIAFVYDDCAGNWGYGVGLDNVAIKEDFMLTWLTLSPYAGRVYAAGSINDTVTVTVGAYGAYFGMQVQDNAVINAGQYELTVAIGVGVTVSADEHGLTPESFELYQNFPNPFNPETVIQFDVAKRTEMNISVYNLLGQRVKTLLNKNMETGTYTLKWNGRDDTGSMLPSGMYFYELKSPLFTSVKKLVLVR